MITTHQGRALGMNAAAFGTFLLLLLGATACDEDTGPAHTAAGTPTATGGSAGSGGAGGTGGVGGGTGGSGGPTLPGLLEVHPQNPAYFRDTSTGNAVYLAGVDNFRGLQDWDRLGVGTFDFDAFVDYLQSYDHNYLRLWCWEHHYRSDPQDTFAISPPHVFQRTGPGTAIDGLPQFDLDALDPAYFDRLRSRIIAAGEHDLWVGVVLFQGFSLDQHSWDGHPFNAANNINGIDGDADHDGEGYETHTLHDSAVTAVQESYVKRVIDTVWDLDNVLYEIANESLAEAGELNSIDAIVAWQHHLIDLIHDYEQQTYGRPHPVGMTMIRGGDNAVLFASPAEWLSPGGRWVEPAWQSDPPPADGTKVVIADTDHIHPDQSGGPGTQPWLWMCLTRGHSTNAVDGDNEGEDWFSVEDSEVMSDTSSYADRVDLASMTPQGALSSTAYCLADPGHSYLVYQPGSGQLSLELLAGTYDYEWFDPATHSVAESGSVTATASTTNFTPPFAGPAVLFVQAP